MKTRNFTLGLATAAALFAATTSFGQLPPKPPPVVTWTNCGNVTPGLDAIIQHGSQRSIDIVVSSKLGDQGQGNGGEGIDWTIIWYPPDQPNVWELVCFTTDNENDGGMFRIVSPTGAVLVSFPIDELDPADLLLAEAE